MENQIKTPNNKSNQNSNRDKIEFIIIIVWVLILVVLTLFGVSLFIGHSGSNSSDISDQQIPKYQNTNIAQDKTLGNSSNLTIVSSSKLNSTNPTFINSQYSNSVSSKIASSIISSSSQSSSSSSFTSSSSVDAVSTREFSGMEFQQIYELTKYNKVIEDNTKPAIFIEESQQAKDVNKYIQNIAENRGYKRRLQAIESELVPVDGQRLQTDARDAWLKLKENAKKDGINLVLVSGYRSVLDQKGLFISDLNAEYKAENILNGSLDGDLNNILNTRSIPGYSRHHTGYTMDYSCNNGDLLAFKDTVCYDWIKKNNFAQAKKVGLIPSYPVGTGKQGPNPEEWEFVWIGEDSLK